MHIHPTFFRDPWVDPAIDQGFDRGYLALLRGKGLPPQGKRVNLAVRSELEVTFFRPNDMTSSWTPRGNHLQNGVLPVFSSFGILSSGLGILGNHVFLPQKIQLSMSPAGGHSHVSAEVGCQTHPWRVGRIGSSISEIFGVPGVE